MPDRSVLRHVVRELLREELAAIRALQERVAAAEKADAAAQEQIAVLDGRLKELELALATEGLT
jgi:hypothetical protein